eukprot:gene13851-13973_t
MQHRASSGLWVAPSSNQTALRQLHQAASTPIKVNSRISRSQVFLPSSQRTQAAAQETYVLDEPTVDFIGVLDGMQTVKGVLHVPADAALVYDVLTNYDSCSRVFRNIADTRTVFSNEGNKQLVQACKWQFLAFSGTFNVQLAVDEQPDSRLLVFRLVESSFMKDFEGRWQVEPLEPGRGCRVEHVLAVKPLVSIPAAIAPYTSSIFKKQVADLLQDLEQEINRQASALAEAN